MKKGFLTFTIEFSLFKNTGNLSILFPLFFNFATANQRRLQRTGTHIGATVDGGLHRSAGPSAWIKSDAREASRPMGRK